MPPAPSPQSWPWPVSRSKAFRALFNALSSLLFAPPPPPYEIIVSKKLPDLLCCLARRMMIVICVKLFFLFGAGASAYCGPCFPKCPPLGGQLFQELAHGGGTHSNLPEDVKRNFSDGGFEEGMRLLLQEDSELGAELQKEMAIYFSQFEIRPNNLYLKFAALIKNWEHGVVLSTLNYDLLLERALAGSGINALYHTGQPTVSCFGRTVSLLKPHGSCNFLPGKNSGSCTGVSVSAGSIPIAAIIESGVRIATSKEIQEHCKGQDVRPPAMCYYSPDKSPSRSGVFVANQHKMWVQSLKQATNVFIIGVCPNKNDTHLWEPLKKAKGTIHFVDPNPSAFQDFTKTRGPGSCVHFAESFEDFLPKFEGCFCGGVELSFTSPPASARAGTRRRRGGPTFRSRGFRWIRRPWRGRGPGGWCLNSRFPGECG